MASLLLKVRHVFNSAQDGHVVVSRLCEQMAEISKSCEENEFWEVFVHHIQKSIIHLKSEPSVERVIDFIANFATYSTRLKQAEKPQSTDEASSSLNEDGVEVMDGLLLASFNYFISLNNAREKAVRLRCCQLVNKMLNLLGDEADIDEDLSDSIYECMMVRIKDIYPPVRNQAVLALYRLQDPSDEECPVIEAYLNSLSKDIHFLVRKTILTKLAISRKTLPYVIERTRDVKEVIRKTAFSILAQKVSYRALSIAQRIKLVTDGLKTESSEDVKKSCLDMLKSWFRSCQHEFPRLLSALDTEFAPETSSLVLDALLKDTSLDQLTEYIGQLDAVEGSMHGEVKMALHEHLSPELVFFWYSISKHLSKDGGDILLQKILPELTHYCLYIRKYAEANFIDSSSALLTADGGGSCEFIMEYLLKIAGLLDLSDEIGRRNLRTLLHDMLLLKTVPITLVKTIVKLYRQVESSEDSFVQSLTETISDIKQPLVQVVSQAMKERQRMLQLQLCRVKALIQEAADDLECAVKQQDFQQASILKDHTTELEQQKLDAEQSLEECSEQMVEEQVECDDDPQTILKCLTVGTSMLSELLTRGLNSTLMALKDELFIEGVKNEDPSIRNEAVKGLGLLCLMKKEFAAQHLVFFLQVVQIDQEFVKLTAVKVIFDLFLMYGMTSLDQGESNDKESEEESDGTSSSGDEEKNKEEEDLTVIPETPPLRQGDKQSADNRDGTAAAESVLSVLLLFLQNESADLRCAVAEGLAKLLVTGRIVSSAVLSRLIVLWYNPVTEDDVMLRHCLGVFFPTFAFDARRNMEVVAEAFLSTIRTITNAPDSSPLSYINVSNVIDLFVQLTDVRNLHKNKITSSADQYDHVHDSIAMKLANEILSDPNDPDLKVFCKTLNQLTICPQNQTVINDLVELARQMLDVLGDNRVAKNAVEKFGKLLQSLTISGESAKDDTLVNQSTVNETTVTPCVTPCVTPSVTPSVEPLKDSTEKYSGQIKQEDDSVFEDSSNDKSKKKSTQAPRTSTRSTRSTKKSASFAVPKVPKKVPRLSKPSLELK